jgi:hypothetical protein
MDKQALVLTYKREERQVGRRYEKDAGRLAGVPQLLVFATVTAGAGPGK